MDKTCNHSKTDTLDFWRAQWRAKILALTLGTLLALPASVPADPPDAIIGINVLLNTPVTDSIVASLSSRGQILDVIPEIKAVRLRAATSELPAIQTLPF